MRNIVIHQVVRGIGAGDRVERVLVRGVAFGLDRLQISVCGTGSPATLLAKAQSDGNFEAWFDASTGLPTAGCRCGELLKAVVADADDPEGCYSSLETRLVCEPRAASH